ncbi:MAG: hypothetical protein AAF355_15440 [Myxococcota bacterium]
MNTISSTARRARCDRWLPLISTAFLCLAVLATGCGNSDRPKSVKTFALAISVSTGERPVAGTSIFVRGHERGVSGTDGKVRLIIGGREGEQLDLDIRCPQGFELVGSYSTLLEHPWSLSGDPIDSSPEDMIPIDVVCSPIHRYGVLVVHAHGRSGVPVVVDGVAQSVTNQDGVAHIHLERAANTRIGVVLDTSSMSDLRPQNPSRAYVMGLEDSIFVFEQTFQQPIRLPRRAPRRRRSASSR